MVEYTIDDIRGPTVAREMAQLKEFVLARFNGAIADAEAAAAAAATAAANAVIGSLTSRVTALEGDMTTAQGDIVTNANAILALDGAAVKLAGTQTITGIKDVPLEATGTASNQIASSQKVKNELDNYAPMMRTSGNQTISGIKTFDRAIIGYAEGKLLGTCGPNAGSSGNIYLLAKVDALPNNEGGVFHIVAGLNNTNYVNAEYRVYNASGTLIIQCIRKSYSGASQKPKLYVYNNSGTIEIYGTSLSWCVPQLFLDYWENGGLIYNDLNRHIMTVSTDFSTVTLPAGAAAETALLTEM